MLVEQHAVRYKRQPFHLVFHLLPMIGECRRVLRVDAETMDAVEQWAADEFRSVNGQLQWIIAEALRKSGRKKK